MRQVLDTSVLITGDDDLLCLKSHQGIRILSPRQFLELLDDRLDG